MTEIESIQTVRVPYDDFRSALKWNLEHPDGKRTRVLRVTPPFASDVSASAYTSREGNHYPVEMDPKPVHIRPRQLVHMDGVPEWPTPSGMRSAIKDHGLEVTDERVDEWLTEAREVFWGEVEAARVDEVELFASDPREGHRVSVVWEDGEE